MAKTVADVMWEMLVSAGVRRCYGIVGDALNPMIDALRRNGSVDFVHVRHEEYGTFAAVADASLNGQPVAVCGTAGPGTAHLINGLIDARKERAPVIAIAGDVESTLIDSEALEELNPYTFFAPAALYTMASASPNAFGAQLAFPGRQTIALCGDGGFTVLGMGDLLTEVQRKAPVIHVVFNNSMLDFVNIEQQEAGLVPFGTDFVNPDFSKVAEACGARGIRIEEPGDVREGVRAALGHKGGPVVVDVVVDRYALSLPSHVPVETVKGLTLSLAKQALSGKMDDIIETVERNVRLL